MSMIDALIGFIGVVIGAACVYICRPDGSESTSASAAAVYTESEEDKRLARQWQNLLSYTVESGGDEHDAENHTNR